MAISQVAFALLLAVAGTVFLWALNRAVQTLAPRLPYPPGPPSRGLISGNKADVSVPWLWRVCADWGKIYGDILYLRVSNRPVIILNSLKDAIELLEKRSQNYSSRPITPMHTLMGFTFATEMRQYTPEWRKHRRILQQTFKPEATTTYRPIQTQKMHDALYALLTSPKDIEEHIRTYAGSIILSITYGYDVAPKNDHLVGILESTRIAFSQGQSPKWMINTFPFLRHVPSWLPGAGFQRYAVSIKKILAEQREAPFKYTTNVLASGSARVSMISTILENCQSEEDVTMLKEAAAAVYGAGVGTTSSTVMVFFIAMITYLDIQKKAQDEIDRVVGGDRLPNYDDQPSLPYITAVLRETLRWQPHVPLGVPHATEEDDTYKGYHIPKGSIVYPNIWAMTRDPERYENPENFNPDRFLDENGRLNDDDVGYTFGFGRRICPGRHLGYATAWLAIATILSTFDIGKPKDASGNEQPLDVKYTDSGLVSYPLAFDFSIIPRSDRARQLILEAHEVESS
ncbi:cytochrome P450 [Pholiota conissans]|uniref:Cytochrome P450 n=1 Tax=Pholiota conissans TaxID=109636 RepID=A0A9P6CZD7_9AGAR|nr:cytochrome P450 [Pholiota conissans]